MRIVLVEFLKTILQEVLKWLVSVLIILLNNSKRRARKTRKRSRRGLAGRSTGKRHSKKKRRKAGKKHEKKRMGRKKLKKTRKRKSRKGHARIQNRNAKVVVRRKSNKPKTGDSNSAVGSGNVKAKAEIDALAYPVKKTVLVNSGTPASTKTP